MLKAVAHRLIASPSIGAPFWRVHRHRSASFMLHRFFDERRGSGGHCAGSLRALLAYLQSCGVVFATIDEQIEEALALRHDRKVCRTRPSVSFTVDDGYADVADIAQPVFAEFGVPFTVFVVPGVIDSRQMFWWDQVEWLLGNTTANATKLQILAEDTVYSWSTHVDRKHVQRKIVASLKALTPELRAEAIGQLAEDLEVSLPQIPPDAYRILTWPQLRELEAKGATVGAHSMTHPILSLCDAPRSRWEIAQSMKRVQEETSRPSQVFCYPNGMPGDFSDREAQTLQEVGAIGAVTAVAGLIRSRLRSQLAGKARWALPRVPYDARPGTLFRAFFG